MNEREWLEAQAERMKDEVSKGMEPTPKELTLRELLSRFGYSRRGVRWVSKMVRILEELDLRTHPDFRQVWPDEKIAIELDPETVEGIKASHLQSDPTVRVRGLVDEPHKPVTVNPSDSLDVATTLMLLNDFSQLPVMEGEREVKGVISWRSIGARLSLGHDCKFVRDCIEDAIEVTLDTPLFEAVKALHKSGCVLVRAKDNRVIGIITRSDVAQQFDTHARPFLLIGEIEGYLRSLIHGKFTVDEIRQAMPDQGDAQAVSGPSGLTLGGYHRLLRQPDMWKRLELKLDRKTFLEKLDWVRERRNEIMHFSTDRLEPDALKELVNAADFFRELRRIKAI